MKTMSKYILLISAVLTFTSCKKYLDVNTNPNAATKPPLNGLLTRVTQSTALNAFRVSNITSYYVQYLASPNPASPTDTYEPIDASSTWTFLYDNMTDIYDLEKLAIELGATQYEGVAKMLMAINLMYVHDLWGDAPFSQAFEGTNLAPGYDGAQTLYQKIMELLDAGIALVQAPGSKVTMPTTGANLPDLIHKGSTAAWVRTGNALKARMLNRLSKTPQYNAASILAATSAAYTAVGQDAAITTFAVRNPWNQVAINNIGLLLDGWLSEYFVDAMDGTTFGIFDPRLRRMTDTTKFGDYRGTRNGKGRVGSGTQKEESYVNTTGYYSSSNSPLFIIMYEEVKFIEAEAAFRSNDRPRAYAAYLEGIRANMNRLGVSATDRDAYVNHPSVSVGEANLTLNLIFKEKYKALYLNPETWNDARRFNYQYQGFQLPLNVVVPTYIRRLVYPSVEISRNGANAPKISDVTSRFWWDQ
ncbi:MAG TPA: SusD/RagB family nutrient-binding outer membrane lipoprotein [Chitinophagaceae bacterium]|nr:SusD/RagB family nutrient-binding outer membrane lipoprotein [Chitinophagaceae bacterium]